MDNQKTLRVGMDSLNQVRPSADRRKWSFLEQMRFGEVRAVSSNIKMRTVNTAIQRARARNPESTWSFRKGVFKGAEVRFIVRLPRHESFSWDLFLKGSPEDRADEIDRIKRAAR